MTLETIIWRHVAQFQHQGATAIPFNRMEIDSNSLITDVNQIKWQLKWQLRPSYTISTPGGHRYSIQSDGNGFEFINYWCNSNQITIEMIMAS